MVVSEKSKLVILSSNLRKIKTIQARDDRHLALKFNIGQRKGERKEGRRRDEISGMESVNLT